MSPISVLIIEKNGDIKQLNIKEYKEDELFKKCGFKKSEGFNKQTEWTNIKIDGTKYNISLYAKEDGKANSENKYEFPPPVDNKLFFGCCALICHSKTDGKKNITNLNIELWKKIYEKLFGGFEDLAVGSLNDEYEEDELVNISKDKKTKKGGYLKDGFVVDSDGDCDDDDCENDDYCSSDDCSDYETTSGSSDIEKETGLVIEDIGSELSEEPYDYSDDDK